MAVRKKKIVEESMEIPVADVPVEKASSAKAAAGKWMSVGLVLLLIGGLAHMLPEQMAPLLNWAVWGVTLQMAVGVLSVIIALYYLLGE